MIIRFLRIFTFLMCVFTTGIVNAHTLHIGNRTYELSQNKYTMPSLAFAIENETWYAPLMTRKQDLSGRHILYNNNANCSGLLTKINSTEYCINTIHDYWANDNCSEIFTDTENYTYDENGRLIGANSNLYLESTNTQFINTGVIPNGNTRFIIDFLSNDTLESGTANHGTPFGALCGIYTLSTWAKSYFDYGIKTLSPKIRIGVRGTVSFLQNIFTAFDGTTTTVDWRQINYSYPLLMFTELGAPGGCRTTATGINVASLGYMKIYSLKLYNWTTPIRHFVPVPACMRIGDFVVPENGMWDIVNQQFYGNSGTGSFIYGKDE